MRRRVIVWLGIAMLPVALVAQTAVTTGDRTTPLRALNAPNEGISNAVLRNQDDVRVLRVVVEPGGIRVMHTHMDVKFHTFVPISGPMNLTIEGTAPVIVEPWNPYYMKAGTRHGFHNAGTSPVEIMEIFVK